MEAEYHCVLTLHDLTGSLEPLQSMHQVSGALVIYIGNRYFILIPIPSTEHLQLFGISRVESKERVYCYVNEVTGAPR